MEPINQWVYGRIYNHSHPKADDMGFRTDVIDAVRELGLPAIRLPGGDYWSDLRKKNGHEKPYGIKTWYQRRLKSIWTCAGLRDMSSWSIWKCTRGTSTRPTPQTIRMRSCRSGTPTRSLMGEG